MEEEEVDAEDEFQGKVREKIEELREEAATKIEEARPEPEEDADEEEPIDRKTVKIRIPDEFLYKLLCDKLRENACRNRGYVLDGYPRCFKDAQYCFLKKSKKVKENPEDDSEEEEEEEELEEGQEKDFSNYEKNTEIFPKSCILMTGSDSALVDRVKELPEEAIEGTHYNFADMTRRLKGYRTSNNSQVAEPSVQMFFEKQTVQVFSEKITTPVCDALDSFKIYIERVSYLNLSLTVMCRTNAPTTT